MMIAVEGTVAFKKYLALMATAFLVEIWPQISLES
jgi:hypothetical protein